MSFRPQLASRAGRSGAAKPASRLTAIIAGSVFFLVACGDSENLERDSSPPQESSTVVSTAESEPVVSAVSTTVEPGSAPDWDLSGGPAAVAARIDELSGQDAGIVIAGDSITVYISGEPPAWVAGLTEAAADSDLKITIEDAAYGQQYLLSAAQELLPQILPLGATSVRPAQDLSSLVVVGPAENVARKEITALAQDLEFPVDVTFTTS